MRPRGRRTHRPLHRATVRTVDDRHQRLRLSNLAEILEDVDALFAAVGREVHVAEEIRAVLFNGLKRLRVLAAGRAESVPVEFWARFGGGWLVALLERRAYLGGRTEARLVDEGGEGEGAVACGSEREPVALRAAGDVRQNV